MGAGSDRVSARAPFKPLRFYRQVVRYIIQQHLTTTAMASRCCSCSWCCCCWALVTVESLDGVAAGAHSCGLPVAWGSRSSWCCSSWSTSSTWCSRRSWSYYLFVHALSFVFVVSLLSCRCQTKVYSSSSSSSASKLTGLVRSALTRVGSRARNKNECCAMCLTNTYMH